MRNEADREHDLECMNWDLVRGCMCAPDELEAWHEDREQALADEALADM